MTDEDRDWMRQAACRDYDPERWFPDRSPTRPRPRRTYRQQALEAQRICLECPVIADCLRYAITTDARYGIWGGATEDDRALLTGRRKYG